MKPGKLPPSIDFPLGFGPLGRPGPLGIRPKDFAPLALEVANGLSQVVTHSRQRSKKKSDKIVQADLADLGPWEHGGTMGNCGNQMQQDPT